MYVPSVFRPGGSEEDRAVDLHEARHGQSADQGQRRSGKRGTHERDVLSIAECAEQAEVDEKLADETVQWRQTTDRYGANQKTERGPAHRLGQTSQAVDFAAVRGVDNGACTQEKQGL